MAAVEAAAAKQEVEIAASSSRAVAAQAQAYSRQVAVAGQPLNPRLSAQQGAAAAAAAGRALRSKRRPPRFVMPTITERTLPGTGKAECGVLLED